MFSWVNLTDPSNRRPTDDNSNVRIPGLIFKTPQFLTLINPCCDKHADMKKISGKTIDFPTKISHNLVLKFITTGLIIQANTTNIRGWDKGGIQIQSISTAQTSWSLFFQLAPNCSTKILSKWSARSNKWLNNLMSVSKLR